VKQHLAVGANRNARLAADEQNSPVVLEHNINGFAIELTVISEFNANVQLSVSGLPNRTTSTIMVNPVSLALTAKLHFL
jgi:hypothetical protein